MAFSKNWNNKFVYAVYIVIKIKTIKRSNKKSAEQNNDPIQNPTTAQPTSCPRNLISIEIKNKITKHSIITEIKNILYRS